MLQYHFKSSRQQTKLEMIRMSVDEIEKTSWVERANAYIFRHYRMLVVIAIIIVFAMSILLPYSTFISYKGNFEGEANPTVVNGLLTATAIVFSFVAFELRDIKASRLERFLLSFPLLAYMMVTLDYYFVAIIVGKITMVLVFETTGNCLFNILYTLPVLLAGSTREEIVAKKTQSS